MRPERPEALIRHVLNETPAQSQPKGAPDGDNQKRDQLLRGALWTWTQTILPRYSFCSSQLRSWTLSSNLHWDSPDILAKNPRRVIHNESQRTDCTKSENGLHIHHCVTRNTEDQKMEGSFWKQRWLSGAPNTWSTSKTKVTWSHAPLVSCDHEWEMEKQTHRERARTTVWWRLAIPALLPHGKPFWT